MKEYVYVEHDDDVAVILINNPPINAGSVEVRRALLLAVKGESQRSGTSAIVIMGAGSTFIAGSDLREFGKPIEDPQLPDVIAAIEACEKPIVAALHGSALGGGLELALGCDARIAAEGTMLGLPEVTLGIIPGAGGTQRLPRLTGIPAAISMICGGERVSADKARSLGIIDAVSKSTLRKEAVSWARDMIGRKARVRDLLVPASDNTTIAAASKAALRSGKNRPAVVAAIEAVVAATAVPFDEAIISERAVFQRLRLSREARALRHQFFAERDAARPPKHDGSSTRPVETIAVIGAGTMGTGIAIAALNAGFDVAVFEQNETALTTGRERISAYYRSRVEDGKLTAAVAEERTSKLVTYLDWSNIVEADLIIEAVFEDLAVKKEVFRRLDSLARPGAILATNTSYIDLDAIAQATSRPHDVIGLHFFSPAHVMRLLEIVRGTSTAPDVLGTSLQLAKRLKKQPIVAENAFGFIGNRIYAAYRKQCEFLLEEGAYPHEVDAALETFGFAMGPFAVADLSGLDIAWRMRNSLAASRDPSQRYVSIPDCLCEAGRLGRKSQAGYYRYDETGTRRQVDPAVNAIIDRERNRKSISPRQIEPEEITRRALLSMVNEAALLLAQGVARQATDIDVAMVNGYGFPKWEGGPVFWARERGQELLENDLDWLASLSGPGCVRGNAALLLEVA